MTTFPEPAKSMKPAIIKCMSSPDKSVINCTGVPIQPSNGALVPVTVPDKVKTPFSTVPIKSSKKKVE